MMAGTVEEESTEVRVVSEPLTYERGANDRSYFKDLATRATTRDDKSAAARRLDAHAAEMRVEIPAREERAWEAAEAAGVEFRLNPSRADGQGGYASPPLWLVDQVALAPRPGRVLADLIHGFRLPGGVSEVNVPRLTTGTAVQVVADGAAPASADIVDAATTSPVVTLAGDGDTVMQLLEQSPAGAHLDHAIFRDLSGAYDARLEVQLINGTGIGGQLLGLLNVPAGAGLANAVTFTDGTPTPSKLAPFAGQAIAQVGNARLLPPETWLMRTSREAWVYLADDRKAPPDAPLGPYPIRKSDAIPATLGAAGNQDAIIACRPSDMLLLESAPKIRVDQDSLSGTLGVRLQLVGYAAALVARYPTGISTITGSGCVVQPGW
jgi:hypothetical protein